MILVEYSRKSKGKTGRTALNAYLMGSKISNRVFTVVPNPGLNQSKIITCLVLDARSNPAACLNMIDIYSYIAYYIIVL